MPVNHRDGSGDLRRVIILISVGVDHQNTIDSNEKLGYNTPTRTLRCITAVGKFKFAKFECTDSNVQKTSFPFDLPYKWHRWPQDSIDVKFDPPLSFLPQPFLIKAAWTGLVSCKFTKSFLMIYNKVELFENF